MNIAALQTRIGTEPDGKWGPNSRAALLAHFTNAQAPAISADDLAAYATRLGCTVAQINAVASVESSGGGFDKIGRPKIRYERHWFHRQTRGKFAPSDYSAPSVDWSRFDSWERLSDACGRDPDAAFSACSWGKFQVMGGHWQKLGYPSPYSMAWTTAQSEADHYEMLVRYIEVFGLKASLRALSGDVDDCRAFAKAYNGAAFETGGYHQKLARAMA